MCTTEFVRCLAQFRALWHSALAGNVAHIWHRAHGGLVRWQGALPVGAHWIIEVVPSCKLLLHLFSGTEKVFTRGAPYATQVPIILQLNTSYHS